MTTKEKMEYQQKVRDSFKFDPLRMYFAYDYVTPSGLSICQPSIKDILDFGEQAFYGALNVFTSNPTQYRLQLWDLGIDWNKVTDYELFCSLYQGIDGDISKFLFNGVDFREFKMYSRAVENGSENTDNDEPEMETVLYNEQNDLLIDCDEYLEISQYLRTCYNIFPKTEKAKGKATKEAIIWEERVKLNREKDSDSKSLLLPLISACVNHPGFKYKPNELKEVKIYEFMDSVQRLQVYENTTSLLKGMYSGFCDTSKIPKENFNFMRDLSS